MAAVKTDQDNSQLTRSLRSKSKEGAEDQEKFDFDSDEYEINSEQKLRFILRGYPSTREKKTELSTDAKFHAKETKETITKMILTIESHDIRKRQKNAGDPHQEPVDGLPDSLFLQYHRKMLRQENRMVQQDVLESEEAADRLTLLYDRLNLPTWPVTLQKITKINDPNDDAEMKLKRSQTKDYIRAMLDKFEMIKKHSSVLQRHKRGNKVDPFEKWPQIFDYIDRSFIRDYDSSTDEEEENLTAEEIRVRRRHQREEKCGGSIYLGLSFNKMENSTFAIVAEPLRRPYVIKSSSEERRLWKSLNLSNKKFRHYKKLAHQTAKKKGKHVIPLDPSFVEATKRVKIPQASAIPSSKPDSTEATLKKESAGDTLATKNASPESLPNVKTAARIKSPTLQVSPSARPRLTVDALNSAIEDLLHSQSQPINVLHPRLIRPKSRKSSKASVVTQSSSNMNEHGNGGDRDRSDNTTVNLKDSSPCATHKLTDSSNPHVDGKVEEKRSPIGDEAVSVKDPSDREPDPLPAQSKTPGVSMVP